jgi:hypothetical protein
MAIEVTQNGNGTSSVNMNEQQLASFLKWEAEAKKRNIHDKLKAMGGNTVVMRRTALVRRRADVSALAPDEDLVAYGEVYKLKNPEANSRLKTFVTDNEIKAYKALDPDLNGGCVTYGILEAKIKELIETKVLDSRGNQVGEDEKGE